MDIKTFQCRYLVVDDIWIPLGEALLIAKFSPIWNKVVDGFGNPRPRKGTLSNNFAPDGTLCIQDAHGHINAGNVRRQRNKLRKRLSLTWKLFDRQENITEFDPHAQNSFTQFEHPTIRTPERERFLSTPFNQSNEKH